MRRMGLLVTFILVAPASTPAAEMEYPIAVAAAADGTVYVADRTLPGVWKVKDGRPEIYFQGSKKFRTPLNAVRCLAIDRDGKLLAGDSATRQIYRFDDSAQPQPLLKGPAGVGIPMALAVGKDGTIFIADLETQRVWKTPSAGGEAVEVIEISGIRSITVDSEDRLWVLTNTAKAIVRIGSDGKPETILAERTFAYPQHILIASDGQAVVSDGYARAIWRITPEGKATKWISEGSLKHPVGIAWQEERLLITDSKERTVFVADADGKVSRLIPAAKPEGE